MDTREAPGRARGHRHTGQGGTVRQPTDCLCPMHRVPQPWAQAGVRVPLWLLSDQPLILVMGANPDADEIRAVLDRDSPVIDSNPRRP